MLLDNKTKKEDSEYYKVFDSKRLHQNNNI